MAKKSYEVLNDPFLNKGRKKRTRINWTTTTTNSNN